METNNNPTPSIGSQGAQDFAAMISSEPTPTGKAPETPPNPNVPSKPLEQTEGVEPATQAAPVVPVAPNVVTPQSHADIIKATADAIVSAQQRAQAPAQPTPPPQATPEEFAQKYKVVRVSEQHMANLLHQDPKVAAQTMNNLLQSTVQQAVLMALELSEANVAAVKGEFQPHIQSWQRFDMERQHKAAEDRFFTSHPDLKDERDLVMEIKDSFLAKKAAGQINFTSEQEAFSAVANTAKTILARVRGTGAAGTAPAGVSASPATGQQTNGRQMSAASSAGRSGTGAAAVKSDVDMVFGAEAR